MGNHTNLVRIGEELREMQALTLRGPAAATLAPLPIASLRQLAISLYSTNSWLSRVSFVRFTRQQDFGLEEEEDGGVHTPAMAAVSEVPEAPSTSGNTGRRDQSDLPPGLRKYRRLEAPTAEQIASVRMFLSSKSCLMNCGSLEWAGSTCYRQRRQAGS